MEDDGLDLASYIRVARRWWWLLAAGAIAGILSGYLLTNDAPLPMYEASAKLLVQSASRPGVPSAGDLRTNEDLAENYSDLLKTRPILQGVVNELGLPFSPDTLASKIDVTTPRSLMIVSVRDLDPELAATIANTTTLRFIEEIRNRQLTQIARFQASLGQFGLAQDSTIIAAQASTMTTLTVIEDAIEPGAPYNDGSSASTGLVVGTVGGLLVAGLLMFIIENMDDKVKSPDEVKTLTGVDALGSVLRQPGRNGGRATIDNDGARYSTVTESYKFIHTNLEFANLDRAACRTLLITSCSPEEGKTTTAANLATAIAKEGKSVILVDADLRKPSVHRIFNLEDRKGLTNMLAGTAALPEILAKTPTDGLSVVPSGPLPPDASVVLRSSKMKSVAEALTNIAEIVIFDSPPLLSVTDPLLLTGLVDNVLLVVDVQNTRRGILKRGAAALRHANAPLVGTVLNKVSSKAAGGYNYYYYYDRYYGSSPNGSQSAHTPRLQRYVGKARQSVERGWELVRDGELVQRGNQGIRNLAKNLKKH